MKRVFRVKFQHGQWITVFAGSFGAAFNEAKRSVCGDVRLIRLASKYEIRKYFGGRAKVPKNFRSATVPKKLRSEAAVGQSALLHWHESKARGIMDKQTHDSIYDMGYMSADGTLNPFPTGSEGYSVWQEGYDESIIANAQNLPADHPDVIRLNCGYYDVHTGVPR